VVSMEIMKIKLPWPSALFCPVISNSGRLLISAILTRRCRLAPTSLVVSLALLGQVGESHPVEFELALLASNVDQHQLERVLLRNVHVQLRLDLGVIVLLRAVRGVHLISCAGFDGTA